MKTFIPIRLLMVTLFLVVIGCASHRGPRLTADQKKPNIESFEVAMEPDARASQMARLMAAYHDNHLFNGAVLVAEDGQVIYEGGFGPAIVEWGVPNQADTKFRIASITKTFTAAMIRQLVDDGRVDLDARLSQYVIGVREEIGTVTLLQLLNHTSGLERYYIPDGETHRPYAMHELVSAINQNVRVIAKPGEKFTYSNAGYVLLTAVIENVSGSPYERFLSQRILEPLGMRDTGVQVEDTAPIERFAEGYRLRHGEYQRAPHVDQSYTRGNGGIYSTVGDLYRWTKGLRSEGILSMESLDATFSLIDGRVETPWRLTTDREGFPKGIGRLAWHRGASLGGYRTQLTMQLDEDRTVILLANLDHCPRVEITQNLFKILMGEPVSSPQQTLSQRIYRVLRDSGVEPALVLLEKAKSSDGATAGLAVNRLVETGLLLIRAQRAKDALAVLSLADRAFPKTPGIMTSLAYAHLKAGDRSRAARVAQEVLAIAPDDKDAAEVLKDATRRH